MASLTLKGIPDDLLCALRDAAESDRRSLNQEVLYLLLTALRARAVDSSIPAPEIQAQLAAWRRLAGKWESDLTPAREAKALTARRSRGRKVDL